MLVAIVSTETTGLGLLDEPVSVGLLLLDVSASKGALVREVRNYYGLREPAVPITAEATQAHGLTIDMVRGEQFDMASVLGILDEAEVLIAHGADFNATMLATVEPGIRARTWRCTLRQIRWAQLLPLDNQKLDTICAHFGIFRPRPQVALDDCLALANILFQRMGTLERSGTYMRALLAEPAFALRSAVAPQSAPVASPAAINPKVDTPIPWQPTTSSASDNRASASLILTAVVAVAALVLLVGVEFLNISW